VAIGVSYRRRTERGKILWRCATRIEYGKDACSLSPTLKEAWLKEQLAVLICGGAYHEDVVRSKVQKIEMYDEYILIRGCEGLNITVHLK
jgi:site-specific DNA recombinase